MDDSKRQRSIGRAEERWTQLIWHRKWRKKYIFKVYVVTYIGSLLLSLFLLYNQSTAVIYGKPEHHALRQMMESHAG
jgi:hypothetical protein